MCGNGVFHAATGLLAALCVAAGGEARADVPSPPSSPPPLPAEVLLYAQNLTREVLFPRYCNSSSQSVHWDVGHAQMWGFCAALQTQLWAVGGKREAGLMVGAKGCLLHLAAQANATRTADFFTSFPMMLAFVTLQRSDSPAKLTKPEAAEVQAYVYKTFETAALGSNNQHYQRGAGLVLAAQTFPSAPKASEWLAYGQAVLQLVVDAGDITEDAPNYNKIDLTYLWLLADLLGDTKALSSNLSFRAMFERFAAQIGPAGGIPSYGDSGAARKDAAAANYTSRSPYENDWGGFMAGFMRASAEYPDGGGGLAAAAAALFASRTLQPYGGAYGDVSAVFRLLYAVPWGATAPPPDPAALGRLQYSRVLTRRDVHGPATPGKVVLRAGGGDASGFLLSDVYASQIPVPPHAHENQHGQVNWYEFGGYPLASSLGYDNRGPADSNLLLMRPASSSFPHPVPKFRAGAWERASIPTIRMRPRASATHVLVTGLTLRVEWDGKPIVFAAARLVLVGPHGTTALDLFSDCDRQWRAGAGVHVSAATEPGQGSARPTPACVWSLPQGKGGDAGAMSLSTRLNLTIDTALYPEMRCDWRLSRNDDVTRTFIMRFDTEDLGGSDGDPAVIDFHASELNFAPRLNEQTLRVGTRAAAPAPAPAHRNGRTAAVGGQARARAVAARNDSVSFMGYSSWFRYDCQLNRTMVLSGLEGVLLVHDSLLVGKDTAAAAPNAGPVRTTLALCIA